MSEKVLYGNEIIDSIRENYIGIYHIYLVSPFLSESSIKNIFQILQNKKKINIDLITKWDPIEQALGVTDIEAFEYVFNKAKYEKWNITITIVNNLHAKAIVLGNKTAIVGSANLTFGGLNKNKELCISIKEESYKINNIRKKIEEIKNTGIQLSFEHFEWRKKRDKEKFDKQIGNLLAIKRIIRKKHEACLTSFIKRNVDLATGNYFDGVINTLNKIEEKLTSRSTLASWLTERADKHGIKISYQRITFLESLGLIIDTPEGIQLSQEGEKIKNNLDRLRFYELLSGEYYGFNDLEIYLEDNPLVHPKIMEDDARIFGKSAFWAKRLLWMESLKIVVDERKGREKYYKRNLYSKFWKK